MAEGFARKYGSDVIDPVSAGLSPAGIIQPLTKTVMEAKNINLDTHSPKSLDVVDVASCDLIVNMSGVKLPTRLPIEVLEWKVADPIGKDEDIYIAVRDQIEMAVMRLILELRKQARNGQTSADRAPAPRAR